MLVVRPKISELDFQVFGRPLHPELFEIFATRMITREAYQLRIDITSAGHLLTFRRDGMTVSEVVASHFQPLPGQLLVYRQPAGLLTRDQLKLPGGIDYKFRYQLEPAEPVTFMAIQRELARSSPCEGLLFQFESSGRMSIGGISYINIQSRLTRVHVRAFHTYPDAQVVMTSESVFRVAPDEN